MTAPTKICCVCGLDVTQIKRTKDAKGNYYCQPCWEARKAGAHPAMASIGAASNASGMVPESTQHAEPPELMSCPVCGGMFPIEKMDESGVCRRCAAINTVNSASANTAQSRPGDDKRRWPVKKPMLRLMMGLVIAVALLAVAAGGYLWHVAGSRLGPDRASRNDAPPSFAPLIQQAEADYKAELEQTRDYVRHTEPFAEKLRWAKAALGTGIDLPTYTQKITDLKLAYEDLVKTPVCKNEWVTKRSEFIAGCAKRIIDLHNSAVGAWRSASETDGSLQARFKSSQQDLWKLAIEDGENFTKLVDTVREELDKPFLIKTWRRTKPDVLRQGEYTGNRFSVITKGQLGFKIDDGRVFQLPMSAAVFERAFGSPDRLDVGVGGNATSLLYQRRGMKAFVQGNVIGSVSFFFEADKEMEPGNISLDSDLRRGSQADAIIAAYGEPTEKVPAIITYARGKQSFAFWLKDGRLQHVNLSGNP